MSNYYGAPPGDYYSNGYSQQQQNHQQPWQQQQQQQQPSHNSNPYLNQPAHYGSQPQDQTQFNQQQQYGGSMNSFINQAAAVGGMNSETAKTVANIARIYGENFLDENMRKMFPWMESTMIMLRSYFAVDNKYVVKKMRKVLLPFISKEWRRVQKNPPGPNMPAQYELPLLDENAPDLYLPSMTLITYVLLCALSYGNRGEFNPEVIPDVTTKCFVTQILEVLAIRFGFYMMQAPIALLDLFTYTGYKYLGLSINMLIGLLLGHFGLGSKGYYITFLWTASACSYFMLKTMANNIPVQTATGGPKREVMVLVFGASQFATMWFVSQTKFL